MTPRPGCGTAGHSSKRIHKRGKKSRRQSRRHHRAPPATARPMPLLGRNIVIRPGQLVPAGWASAEQCAVTASDVRSPAELVARLRRHAAEREPCVFVLADDIASVLEAPQTTSDPLHDLGPTFAFELSAVASPGVVELGRRSRSGSRCVAAGERGHGTRRDVANRRECGRRRAARRHTGVARRWAGSVHGSDRRNCGAPPRGDRAPFAGAVRLERFERGPGA